MSYRKYGLRAFGLSIIAVLGLMAFMAAGAQASWLYLLSNGTLDELTSGTELVEVLKDEEGNLLLSNGIEIKCAVVKGEDLLLEGSTEKGKALAKGKVAFSECKTFNKGVKAESCNPTNQPLQAAGTAHVILHNGINYVLFAPNAGGESFTEIIFGPKCALVESSEVTGELVAECGELNGSKQFVEGDCATHRVQQYLRAALSQSLFGASLKFGELGASLDGIAIAELAGTREGLAWSGEV